MPGRGFTVYRHRDMSVGLNSRFPEGPGADEAGGLG